MQIMAESEDHPPHAEASHASQDVGLGVSDIETNVYEGGFKSWEGSVDLARLVLERGPRKDIDDLARVDAVVEHALANELSLYFTLADYNESVVRLVTAPNLLLVWALQYAPNAFSPSTPRLADNGSDTILNGDGDLEITAELLKAFYASLKQQNINLVLISGPWSAPLIQHLPLHPDMSLLVLAAETIYSPSSLESFTSAVMEILRRVKMGKAIVAAKRVYFGVGGSVDEFKVKVAELGGVAYEVENSGIEGMGRGFDGSAGGGVGRCLLEVQVC